MSKKIIWGIVGIIVLVAVFYGGVSYGKSQTPASATGATAYSGMRGGRGTGGFGGFGGSAGGGFTSGQIISKDATSITVQLAAPAGGATGATSPVGSKIVLLGNSTKITKSVAGTMSDLSVGTQVSVTGTTDTNSGSISAQTIQIRPSMPTTTTTPSVIQ